MKLIPEQKRFVREHFEDMSVREMAGHLGVEPKDVRWAMAELGLVPKEVQERQEREGRQRSRAWRRERWRQRLGALRRAAPGFWLVTGLALVVRLIQLVFAADSPLLLQPSGIAGVYHQWGLLLAGGDWASRFEPVFYHPPAYAYLLGVVYSIAGPSPLAVCILQVIMSSVTAGLVLLLGRRVFGPVSGLVAGVGAIVYGMFVFEACFVLPATLVVLLSAGGLVALVGAMQRPHPLRWLWSGLLLGLLTAARGPLVVFLPLALAAVLTWFGSKAAKRWIPAWFLLLSGAGLAIAPVILHNGLVGAEWTSLTASFGPDLYTGNHRGADGMAEASPVYQGRALAQQPDELRSAYARIAGRDGGAKAGSAVGRSRFWIGKALDEIRKDKILYINLLYRKLRIYFSAHELPADRYWASPGTGPGLAGSLLPFGLVAPLALLGLLISIRGFRKRGVLVWFVLAHLIGLLVFWVDARHRLPVVPVMLVYAAAMLRWLWQKAAKRKWLPLLVSVTLAAGGYVVSWWPLPPAPVIPAAKPAAAKPAAVAPAPEPHTDPSMDAPGPGLDPPPGQPGSIRLPPPGASIPQ